MSEHDLPDDIASAMRDVQPADPVTKDRHISAALDSWVEAGGHVSVLGGRRLLPVAAALVIALGSGVAGWSLRGTSGRQVLAGEPDSATVTDAKGSVAGPESQKQVAPPDTAPCDASAGATAIWLGSYTADGHTYSLFVDDRNVTWYDTATCVKSLVVAHPTTTVP